MPLGLPRKSLNGVVRKLAPQPALSSMVMTSLVAES